MSSNEESQELLRVLFLGMRNEMSRQAFVRLIAAPVDIVALIVAADREEEWLARSDAQRLLPPDSNSELPMADPFMETDVVSVAWNHQVPVWAVSTLGSPVAAEFIHSLAADIACVACFPERITPQVLGLTRLGFLNLHPSLLPHYRGPTPLFWLYRNGDQARFGVTIHKMDKALDTGVILLQRSLSFLEGASGREVESLAGAMGGELFAEVLRDIDGSLARATPQPEIGSYYSWPQAKDFALERTWPAMRAFNFMRATADWGHPYELTVGSQSLELHSAIAYYPDKVLPSDVVFVAGTVQVQFSPGVLEAAVVARSS